MRLDCWLRVVWRWVYGWFCDGWCCCGIGVWFVLVLPAGVGGFMDCWSVLFFFFFGFLGGDLVVCCLVLWWWCSGFMCWFLCLDIGVWVFSFDLVIWFVCLWLGDDLGMVVGFVWCVCCWEGCIFGLVCDRCLGCGLVVFLVFGARL